MGSIAKNLQDVRARIAEVARAAGRSPQDICLLAVSKTWPAESVRAAAAAGQRSFGENYVQEAVGKIAALRMPELEWHFIGPLQSNKTRLVAENFDWVHSIDRLKLAERLSAQRPTELPPLNVCLQVNVSDEDSKSGCGENEVVELARAIAALPHIRLRGLMAIPAPAVDFAAQRAPFAQLRRLAEHLRAHGLAIDALSMGMSHDLAAAIHEGATIVRVGTAIFGERSRR
jgi:PLP dependent protein